MANELIKDKDDGNPLNFERVAFGDEGDVIVQSALNDLKFGSAPIPSSIPQRADSGIAPPVVAGTILWNNVSQTAATKLFVSETTADGDDAQVFIEGVKVGDSFYIQAQNDVSNWQSWNVTGVVAQTGYEEYDVTLIDSHGPDFDTAGAGQKLIFTVSKHGGVVAEYFNGVGMNFITASADLSTTYTFADATAGDIVATLPDPAVAPVGALRIVKNISGNNVVTCSGNINGQTTPLIFGFSGEVATFKNTGSTWQILTQRTFTFATLESDAVPFAITSTPTKYTGFSVPTGISTKNKLEALPLDSAIELFIFTPPVDGMKFTVNLSFEHNNNAVVTGQIYLAGNPYSDAVYVTGRGSGKPVTMVISSTDVAFSNGQFSLYLSSDAGASTLTPLSGSITAEAIGA